MITFNVLSMLQISLSYREEKIGSISHKLLMLSHIYVIISMMWFGTCFAVQPTRDQPISMIFLAAPYLNAKIAWCVLQISVVKMGGAVSWANLFSSCGKKLFLAFSWLHVVLLFATTVIGTLIVVNAIGDMGEEGLVGHGLWWSVRDPTMIGLFNVFVDKLGFLFGFIIPLVQAMIIKSMESRDIAKAHTITFYVEDSQDAIY